MERLKNLPPGAAEPLRSNLEAAYAAKWGTVSPAAALTIANIARLQRQIDELLADAERCGPFETVRNGRQAFKRPRKGVETAARLMRECARLTDSLKLAAHNPRGAERYTDEEDADNADAAPDDEFDTL